MEIQSLVDIKALRCYATTGELVYTIAGLVSKALELDISPRLIEILESADFNNTDEYEIILFGSQ